MFPAVGAAWWLATRDESAAMRFPAWFPPMCATLILVVIVVLEWLIELGKSRRLIRGIAIECWRWHSYGKDAREVDAYRKFKNDGLTIGQVRERHGAYMPCLPSYVDPIIDKARALDVSTIELIGIRDSLKMLSQFCDNLNAGNLDGLPSITVVTMLETHNRFLVQFSEDWLRHYGFSLEPPRITNREIVASQETRA